MVDRIYGWLPPRLYIEEWMETKPGLDRKRLAERMGVSAGTVTKKLQKPEAIDQIWLAGFAEALGLADVTDLYRNPNAPTPTELLSGLSWEEQQEVYNFAEYVKSRRIAASDIVERYEGLAPDRQQVAKAVAETSYSQARRNYTKRIQGKK